MKTPLENPRWAPWLAALVPLVVYGFSASGHGYWLDSGEFTAAAVELDIPHPPGHPLASLWGKLFTLLPVGPLPYRVAMGQATAAALSLALLQIAFARSIVRMVGALHASGVVLSLAATFALAGSYGYWFQAVRAEVYALAALLVCLALERLTLLACDDSAHDPRPLYLACFALGLGLANHHFIAVLALPSLLVELARLLHARGPRVLGMCLLAGAFGLSTYVYLPLRALDEPAMDLGHPVGLRDLFWVVSAQVYARNIGSEALQPLNERFADLLVLLVENFTPLALMLALLGAYALLRVGRTRRLAYVWLVTALVSLGGRAYLNPVRANPDVLGYMMPGFAALMALAACGAAALLSALPASRSRLLITRCASATLLVCGLLQFAREDERASLRQFAGTVPFDDLRRRALPPRSLVVLTNPATIFRHWEGEAVERLRDDVIMLPLPFLGYGGSHAVWSRKHPELRPLIEWYLARQELPLEHLRAIAGERPLFIELDTRIGPALFDHTLPEGQLARFARIQPSALARAAQRRAERRTALAARLGEDRAEDETRKQLLWSDYVAALALAHLGLLEEARGAVRSGLALSPRTRELRALDRALAGRVDGPLDVHPFLPPAQHPDLRPALEE